MTRFNSCMQVSMKQFEEAAQAAIDSIPEQFQPYLENTVFILEERSRDGLMGLYEGAGALGAGEGLPERITLYKHSHEQASRSYRELVEEVRRTIVHEVGHHFGMEEDDLPYRGAGEDGVLPRGTPSSTKQRWEAIGGSPMVTAGL